MEDGAAERLRDAIQGAVDEALSSGTANVAFSGGLDSGIIAAMSKGRAKLYTVGTEGAYDVTASAELASIMGTEWEHIPLTDGGIGDSWGIPLAQAKRDGYKKFFIVRTQKRDYRKTEDKHPGFIKMLLGKNKAVADRMLERYKHYNAILDEIDELEARGEAYVFCPHTVLVKNTTLKQPLLEESFRLGYEQAQSELSAWRDFL